MNVVEIFQSIDGEAVRAGMLSNFIRLAGCNLRCSYCDTEYALLKNQGIEMSVATILSKLDNQIKNITLTGGEPLWNKEEAMELLDALVGMGYKVSVETNGSIDLKEYIKRYKNVVFIVDYKCPDSNMEDKMILENFNILREIDCVKFVVSSKRDLEKMKSIIENTKLKNYKTPIFMSPVYGEVELSSMVDFLLESKLTGVRMQLQMHKFIWHPDTKGV